ncbi:hypothetical protein [Nocardioides sp. XL1]|uniref:hypothetical protein n=1 Tax=Nocardioides sp. XL1 TaxID=2003120 RepID=UPI000056F365|nr:hypothetical protein [Nocardioides sp. XL1]ABL81766.1 hypothetical protein Noca_2261 [Nocardioides sp. JS614]
MSRSPCRARRGSTHPAVLATLAAVLASALCLSATSPAAAAEPVEDMGCRMVIWASDSVFDTSYAHDGMRHAFRGCLVKRSWSTKSYRSLMNRQWRLHNHLASSECRVGDYHSPASGEPPTRASASSSSSTASTTWCPAEQSHASTSGSEQVRPM